MDISLSVEPRDDMGKGAARKLRATGRIPGVIYAEGSDARHVALDPRALTDIFRKTRNRNTVVKLDVGGDTVHALVQEAQRHPVSRDLLHVDFLALADDRMVTVMVPVEPVGKPKGATMGGRIRVIRRTLKTKCPWDAIPATHQIDVSEMSIGDMYKASAIPTAEGVEILFDSDFNVLSCYGKKKSAKKEEA